MRDRDGGIWICKFSEPGSTIDRQRVEFANLRMAAKVGLEVPEVRLVETGLGSVLQVRRFYRNADLQRLHYASAISLVSAFTEYKRLSSARDQSPKEPRSNRRDPRGAGGLTGPPRTRPMP